MAKKEVLKPFIRYWEGGYACVPGDPGGATKWGVTIGTFRNIFGKDKTVADLKAMTEEQWDYIFGKKFWDKWKADQIENQAIANLLVDWYWGSGQYGIKLPQKILGVSIDGIVGPKTISAVNNYPNQRELFVKLWKEHEAYYTRIATGGKKKFLKGWLNRLNGIKYDCLMAGKQKITW